MSSDDRHCGTCIHYALPHYYAVYDCTWADTHAIPEVLDQGRVFPKPSYGTECETWEQRSDAEVTEETCQAERQRVKDFWDGHVFGVRHV